jgi:hypothetical protein
MALYELAIMGTPSDPQLEELRNSISQIIEIFGLRLGHEVAWSIRPTNFEPLEKIPAAVAFFGSVGVSEAGLNVLLRRGVPILPVASALGNVATEIPAPLRMLNCLTYPDHGPQRISTSLLECVGLLPRQRRVFVSYRRDAARQAALQLFNALSGRVFDVFLDTHGGRPRRRLPGGPLASTMRFRRSRYAGDCRLFREQVDQRGVRTSACQRDIRVTHRLAHRQPITPYVHRRPHRSDRR